MMSAYDSCKTTISCLNIKCQVPVDELDVLIVPMMAYDLVLVLPRFQSRNHEIDWSKGQMLGLRTLVGNPRNVQTITSLPQGDGSVEDGACEPPPAAYIHILGATAFHVLVVRLSQPSPEDLTRAQACWEHQQRLKASPQKIKWEKPRPILNAQTGSSGGSCSGRASAGEC